MKYMKLPVVIDAMKLEWGTWNAMCDFAPVGEGGCRGVFVQEDGSWSDSNPSNTIGLLIPTLEGLMLARQGDYIIKGVKGEFYPCKPDIFEQIYRMVV